MPDIKKIAEWTEVSAEKFNHEIYPLNKPAVLRGLVNDWPMVQASELGVKNAVSYISSFDNHTPVYTVVGEPEIKGRFFYSNDLQGVNFQRTQGAITAILEQLLDLRGNPKPHAVAVQAAIVSDVLPGFELDNKNPILAEAVTPTLWLGNRAMVAPHYDVHDNIACVVSGRRKFTVFPPNQIANLYVGPTLGAPGGVPISMVDLKQPDLERFPKFREAAITASEATLNPGDAIFIPTPWWHAVESLEDINILINYWWGGLDSSSLSPNHSLTHSMLTVAKLSEAQRESWRHFFDYFVFQKSGDPKAHLPADLNDMVTSLTDEQQHSVFEFLKSHLK
ncbi:MAG: hypothetical protein ACI854_000778 [Arenicella sp.]|jgi:hypothetical protein